MMRKEDNLMTFGGHLEMLRRMLFRIIVVIGILSCAVFCQKSSIWPIILAPSECDFSTYLLIEKAMRSVGATDFAFERFNVELITTDLSSQFMMHVTTSVYIGLLCASPYVLYELFLFISPALYKSERKYSVVVMLIIYALFLLGVLMSYFVLFPISFRFLGTYSVEERIHSTITLDSYVSTFTSLTLLMGTVFQFPIIAYCLTKLGLIHTAILSNYRKHSFIVIMLTAAVITPPDIMTLILVTMPLYLLYEISIWIVRKTEK